MTILVLVYGLFFGSGATADTKSLIEDPCVAAGLITPAKSTAEVLQLFEQLRQSEPSLILKSNLSRFLVAAYGGSRHPERDAIFETIFAKLKSLDLKMVQLGRKSAEDFVFETTIGHHSRAFLSAIQFSAPWFKKVSESAIARIVKLMIPLTRDQRLIVFAEAQTTFNQIGKSSRPREFFDLLWEVAHRLQDKDLIKVTKEPRDLYDEGKDFRHVIDRKLSGFTFAGAINPDNITHSRFGTVVLLGSLLFMALSMFTFIVATVRADISVAAGTFKVIMGIFGANAIVGLSTYFLAHPFGKAIIDLENRNAVQIADARLHPVIDAIAEALRTVTAEPLQARPTPILVSPAQNVSGQGQPQHQNQDQIDLQRLQSEIHPLTEMETSRNVQLPSMDAVHESWGRFDSFFRTLNGNLVGRQELVRIMQYALLGERHNLILFGPAGVGKSKASDALAAISDREAPERRTSWKMLMTPETARSEIDGPLSWLGLQEDDFRRVVKNNILKFNFAVLDELFDYPRVRTLLNTLEEGTLNQGAQIEPGILQFAMGTTNKYISEVYESMRGNNAQAPQDRFAWLYLVPDELSTTAENLRLMNLRASPLPPLYIQDLAVLRSVVPLVHIPLSIELRLLYVFQQLKSLTAKAEQASREEYLSLLERGKRPEVPPYRSSRVFSPRSLLRAMGILRIIVTYDWLAKGANTPLVAGPEHIAMMASYFGLGGPRGVFLDRLIEQTYNPLDRQQLGIVRSERGRFEGVQKDISMMVDQSPLSQLLAEVEASGGGDSAFILPRLYTVQEGLKVQQGVYQRTHTEDGPVTADDVALPSLIHRYNRLLGTLGFHR